MERREPEIGPIAVVDDDPTVRFLLRRWLEDSGYTVVEYGSGRAALRSGTETWSAACVDLGLGDMDGREVLQHLAARDASLPVVIVTADRDLEAAIGAMQAGAYDYVTKPLDKQRLVQSLNRALERRALMQRVSDLETKLDEARALDRLIGESAPMRRLHEQINRVLDSDVAVCVFGESGTGKELVAQAIHAGSRRQSGPFVAINCASIPEGLLESELFGHEKGAFTGALAGRRGRFEEARGGTLFLDELGEMSPATQASLLRALQERKIRRVGGSSEIEIDARVICATHRDLRQEVTAGRFREDLYYRLVVFPIQLPPLRERGDDIPRLVGHFLKRFSSDVSRSVTRVSPQALEALSAHRWPGNVRELSNVIHRAMLSCDSDEIALADLPPELVTRVLPSLPASQNPPSGPGRQVVPLKDLELGAIRHALDVCKGNIAGAARLLGIGRATIYRRLAEVGEVDK